ncbi:hypothetical protein ACSQ67_024611 [Phaseolus vulgaris]
MFVFFNGVTSPTPVLTKQAHCIIACYYGRFRSQHYPSRTASDLTEPSRAMEPPTPTSPLYKCSTSRFYCPTSQFQFEFLDLPPKTATTGFNFVFGTRQGAIFSWRRSSFSSLRYFERSLHSRLGFCV